MLRPNLGSWVLKGPGSSRVLRPQGSWVLKGSLESWVLVFRYAVFLKARIYCEIFLSDYFMKHSLMHISFHIIGFHENHVKYVKRNPSGTIMLFSQIILPEMRTEGISSPRNSADLLQ